MPKFLIVICGPTGIGKTAVSIEIAQYFKTMIISADSRQIYKEMSIGTAIPSPGDLQKIRHEFIQARSVHEKYNASMFENDVMNSLTESYSLHDLIVMTGGSGLYIDAVCTGIDDLPSIDPEVRIKWADIYSTSGLEFLQKMVREIDPDYYEKTDRNNPKRLLKAIEVYDMTGKPYSSFLTHAKKHRLFLVHKFGLNMERKELYRRINQRVDNMIEAGLVDEATKLYPFRHLTSLNTVGYKELFDYIEGKQSLKQSIELIKNHTRAYARRQITWFNKDMSIHWYKPDEVNLIIREIEALTSTP